MITPDDATLIEHPAVISNYLRELMAGEENLQVSFPGSTTGKTYEARIGSIDTDNRVFTLTLFTPRELEDSDAGQPVEVKTWFDQGSLQFVTDLCPPEDADSLTLCHVRFPGVMTRQQLRSSFRVSLQHHDTRVELSDENNTLTAGICQNLSQGGMLCQVDEDACCDLREGQILSNGFIEIATLLDFPFAAEISHIKILGNGRKLLGLKFVDLPLPLQRNISRAIATIERNNLRATIRLNLPGGQGVGTPANAVPNPS